MNKIPDAMVDAVALAIAVVIGQRHGSINTDGRPWLNVERCAEARAAIEAIGVKPLNGVHLEFLASKNLNSNCRN